MVYFSFIIIIFLFGLALTVYSPRESLLYVIKSHFTFHSDSRVKKSK